MKGNGGKPGLCWPNKDGLPIDEFIIGETSWYYTWSPLPGWDAAPNDIMYCNMLWGYRDVSEWQKNVLGDPEGKKNKWNQHKCAMGMNEVNQVGQSKMTPQEGCKLWRDNISPLKTKHGWHTVSPSTTSAPDGMTWMKEFKKECPVSACTPISRVARPPALRVPQTD